MDNLSIDPNASTAPFEQLREQLIARIMQLELPAGTRLPSVRGLATELGLAPGTVARAYKELEAEGYLITRGRNGTTVAPVAAIDEQSNARAAALANEYVAAMKRLGFGAEATVGEVRRALEHL